MKELIDSCVDGVIELIEDQIDKVRSDKSRRVKVSVLREIDFRQTEWRYRTCSLLAGLARLRICVRS
jgi:hypothetical protein